MADGNTDVAYEYIRNKILVGEYQLGSALRTNRLATEIGVSRTPIREALRLLETDGLVVIRPRIGARVTSLNIDEFTQLCSMRMALETYAAGLAAAHHTEAGLQEIRAALGAMRAAARELASDARTHESVHEFQRQDLQFHIKILNAAKNPLIKGECTRIHLLDHLLSGKLLSATPQSFEWTEDTIAEHEAILRAIEQRDVAATRAAMERHLQPVVNRCIAALDHEASYRNATLSRIQMIDTAVRS